MSGSMPLSVADTAGNNENAAGMVSFDGAPSGGDEQIDAAICVDVAHADGVKSERLAGNPGRVGPQQAAVAP